MIKVIDPKGVIHEITDELWRQLEEMPKCKFRLADIPVPKEVLEFKPTPAKECKHPDIEQPEQQEEIKQFIEKKKTKRGRKK